MSTASSRAFEYAIGAKWLELLKEISPGVTRAAVSRDPTIAAGIGQFAAIQAVVPVGMELSAISLQDPGAIETAVAAFARSSNRRVAPCFQSGQPRSGRPPPRTRSAPCGSPAAMWPRPRWNCRERGPGRARPTPGHIGDSGRYHPHPSECHDCPDNSMRARSEHLRQQAHKCAVKAAAAKDPTTKASFEAVKQLLILAKEAEKVERNRRAV
jgi:hypothetical protein